MSRLAIVPALLVSLSPVAAQPIPRPPNILLIVVDALRPDRLSPYGAKRNTSPRLQRLADQGSLFRRAVAQANWTLPSLSTIMTGLYPSTHGARLMPEGDQWPKQLEEGAYRPGAGHYLAGSRETLAELLARRGYRTAAVVSGGLCRSEFGFGQGFAEYHNLGSRLASILPVIKEALSREPGRPFFVYLHLSDVHDPYSPAPPYDRLWDPDYHGPADGRRETLYRARGGGLTFTPRDFEHLEALYDGAIAEMDSHLAELLDFVDRLPGGSGTAVIVTADHGEAFNEHGVFQHGHAGYNEELRVPLIISVAARGRGRKIDEPVELADLMPTILSLAGAASPKGLAGRSLLPLLDGRRWKDRPAYSEVAHIPDNPLRAIAIQNRRWKFLRALDGKEDELYDLAVDPGETRNLAASLPRQAAHWRRLADERLAWARAAAERWPQPDTAQPDIDPALREKLKASGYLP